MNEDEAIEIGEFSKEIDETVREYVQNNTLSKRKIADCYAEYVQQCHDLGWKPVTRASFTRQVRIGFGIGSAVRKGKDKKSVRIFVNL